MQESIGYLEQLYEGGADSSVLDGPILEWNEEKVQNFLKEYHAALEGTTPLGLEKSGRLPDEVMAGLKRSGIFGLTIPAEYRGLGMSLKEYLRVVEEAAKDDMALVLIPLAHLSIGMKGILLFGNEEQKQRYLPRAATGEMVFAYCLTEPKQGSDAQHIETRAKLSEDGTHYILNGGKTYITNGNYAGGLTVFARIEEAEAKADKPKLGAFIVETGWDGVKVGADMAKMGLKISSTTAIQFKDVKIPVENRLGEEGDGFKIAMTILNYGRLGLGAASAGIMFQAYRDMKKRAGKRIQFGRPIAEFELIQEKIGRAYAHGIAASAITYQTASLLEKSPLMNVAMESSHTKLYGTNAAWDTLYDAVQTYGGSGYIATQGYEKRMRDFRVTTIFEGTSEIHSIYPPLAAARSIMKRLKGKGGLGKFFTLLGIRRSSPPRIASPAFPGDTGLEQALIRRAIKLVTGGMMKFGRTLPEREFLLRRATRLSLYYYILLSTRRYISELKAEGRHSSEEANLGAAYAILAAEAEEALALDGDLRPDPRWEAYSRLSS